MKEENLHMKLVDKLVKKKFEYWKEEFIKELKEKLIKEEVKFLQVMCMSGGIKDIAMKKVFNRIEELKSIKKLAGKELR